MKVLIGILAHQLDSEVVKGVFSQDWADPDGFDVLTCWGADIRPGESRFAAVTRKYQALQRAFLAGPWDVLMTVEQDMLIPPDALTRLARLIADGADIAYGLYVWRYDNWRLWNAHPRIRVDEDEPYFTSLSDLPEEAKRHWGKVVQVEGLGFGCTLLSRQTLVRLPLRQFGDHSQDTALAIDARKEGLTQVCDLGVVCGHQLGDGRVIWPDPESDTLYRIEGE